MNDELFINLRYCFQGGYTLPQYCIDNGIKKPLFVMEKEHEWFLREIYAQFKYDKRLPVQFCFIDAEEKDTSLICYGSMLGKFLSVRNINSMNLTAFDKIFLFTNQTLNVDAKKVINLADLKKSFEIRTYLEIPLLHFLKRYPKVKLFLTNFPNHLNRYEGGMDYRSQLWDAEELKRAFMEGKEVKSLFDKFGYNKSEIIELITIDKSKKNLDGTTAIIGDDKKKLQRIINGKRETAYSPESYSNRIYFIGPCHFFGRNAPYNKTIESYLQQMLNQQKLPYRVENYGQAFAGRSQDMFYNLNALNPEPDDIIFFYFWDLHSTDDVIPFCDVSDAFDPPNDYKDIFCAKDHVNELGYKLVAEKYFKFLTDNKFFRDIEFNYPSPPPINHRYGIPLWVEEGGIKSEIVNEELETYKQQLKTRRLQIGALVINANPFTLGHQYLVEYAAARVAKLYVFVVEENKSDFPFADRIELVKQGVKHLSNVEVLPSGKFIISQTTFSGYFSKAELQDVQIDSSMDVEIFGKEIASSLGITVRFAGEEPTDNVTRQYNKTMKEILPRYGVEFCEIPRKEFGGEPISASKVREALKVGNFDKIKNLVPYSTLKYLRGQGNESLAVVDSYEIENPFA